MTAGSHVAAMRRPRRSLGIRIAAAAVLLAAGAILVYSSGILEIRGERVTIPSGDVTLAGTIALPRQRPGPFPAAVVVHGSGRGRWSDLKGYARHLVPLGMAVLMYDKRGVGRSGGTDRGAIRVADSETRLEELAGDARAALDYLRGRPDIDPDRVGFVGGSQAGWVIPLAAAGGPGAAFMVLISGPAVTYGEEIYYSQLTGDDPGPHRGLSEEEIDRRLANFEGPFGFDPVPILDTLDVPSLWILGGRDRSVPTRWSLANLERIQEMRPEGLEIQLYPEGDHSIRDVTNGQRIDYWSVVRAWLESRGFGDRASAIARG